MNNNTIANTKTPGSTLISGEYYTGLCLAFTIIGLLLQVGITYFALKKKFISSLSLCSLLLSTSYIPLLISQSLQESTPGFQVTYFILFGFGSIIHLTSQYFQFLKPLLLTSPLIRITWLLMFSSLILFIIFIIVPCILIVFTQPSMPILNLCSIWTLLFLVQSPILTISVYKTTWKGYLAIIVMFVGGSLVLVGMSLGLEMEAQGVFVNGVVVLVPGVFVDAVFGEIKSGGGEIGLDSYPLKFPDLVVSKDAYGSSKSSASCTSFGSSKHESSGSSRFATKYGSRRNSVSSFGTENSVFAEYYH
jgi:hypothetical protein